MPTTLKLDADESAVEAEAEAEAAAWAALEEALRQGDAAGQVKPALEALVRSPNLTYLGSMRLAGPRIGMGHALAMLLGVAEQCRARICSSARSL